MVQNCGKGGSSHKKMKKTGFVIPTRELYFKEEGQDYALVVAMLGHNRCTCKLFSTETETLGTIRGSMRRKHVYRISKGDIVLVGLRDFQDDKVDIMHLYTSDEVRLLMGYNEITNTFVMNQKTKLTSDNEEDEIQFADI